MGDRVLHALASALAKGNGKVKVRYGRWWGRWGRLGSRNQWRAARKEVPAQTMPGRDAEEGDTSGKGIGTDVGGSITVVADTEGGRDGEEISPD